MKMNTNKKKTVYKKEDYLATLKWPCACLTSGPSKSIEALNPTSDSTKIGLRTHESWLYYLMNPNQLINPVLSSYVGFETISLRSCVLILFH